MQLSKKCSLISFLPVFLFLHLKAVMCDQCVERGFLSCLAGPYQLQLLKLKGLTAEAGAEKDFMLLFVMFFCGSLSTFLSPPQHIKLACAQTKKP